MFGLDYNVAIVLLGTSLLGACTGLVGSFAVLRGRALAGDALAHAALPGICIAFLLVQERSLPWLLTGALVSGLVGILVISGLRHGTRIKEDAAIGIVLSVFYGLGVTLMSVIQHRTTTGSKAGLKSFILGKTAGMIAADVYLIAGVALVCLIVTLLLYKEFKLVSFDPGFARVQGWPAFGLDLALMGMVALTVVIGLPAVGVVLVASALIIPAAAARFWTSRLSIMLLLSVLIGAGMGAVGSLVSARSTLAAGPAIVLAGTLLFLISMLFAPRRGAVARYIQEQRFRRQIEDQETLLKLYAGGLRPETVSTRCLLRLTGQGYLHFTEKGGWKLTSEGLSRGRKLWQTQQLWERFMDRHADLVAQYSQFDRDQLLDRLPTDLLEELKRETVEGLT